MLKKLTRRLSRDQQGKRALKRMRRMAERTVHGAPPAGQHQDALAALRLFGVKRNEDGQLVRTIDLPQTAPAQPVRVLGLPPLTPKGD